MDNALDRRGLFAALGMIGMAGAFGKAEAADGASLTESRVLKYADLPLRKFDNGGEQRRVMAGTLATGEFVEIHETMLPAGEMPHPPHAHPNSEWLFIQTGSLEYIHSDGSHIPTGPGDIVFTASNKTHGLKNIGATPATYIVVSVSKQLPEG
ncbi:quercetin dioxygenase-like cupin family protein [Rhizomicrobium palustre]|uniref:Quercetin dioxygenase-like cupin family protein n=1 Tax=Rhizomicrobium palustre TaxID=189966 RepID=A0A846MYG4_9PROT|nr:cupin domain-containing protein [Rhizomicrobium palustre]NIK88333.1 quercetin dioxygenase-like cupin family protein [Rhizomicrobium palustre]